MVGKTEGIVGRKIHQRDTCPAADTRRTQAWQAARGHAVSTSLQLFELFEFGGAEALEAVDHERLARRDDVGSSPASPKRGQRAVAAVGVCRRGSSAQGGNNPASRLVQIAHSRSAELVAVPAATGFAVGAPVSSEASRRATGTPVGVGRHHFASACATTAHHLVVLGVRSDDERPTVGDAMVLRLRPGTVDAVASLPTVGRTLAASGAGLFVVDVNDVLWSVRPDSEPVELRYGIRALANHGIVVDSDGGVWRCTCDGTAQSWGTVAGAHLLGPVTEDRAIVGTTDGRVVEVDANGRQRELLSVGANITALSSSLPMVVAAGKRVVTVDEHGTQQSFTVPHE
ncbi:LOW QUALITY PROTEIN: hypothetical protein DAPPUDRAFT_279933, partial [Daphnia pulex]